MQRLQVRKPDTHCTQALLMSVNMWQQAGCFASVRPGMTLHHPSPSKVPLLYPVSQQDMPCPLQMLRAAYACREDLEVGDEVQIMPCDDGHVFHPPCLKPWLVEHNSCPVCRHELATDDDKYERRKEREREDAEGAKGSANALQQNEFIFV